MKPYYEQDGITIYHGDAVELLPEVVADVAHGARSVAVISDPPYGLNRPYGRAMAVVQSDGDTRAIDWLCRTWAPRPAILFAMWQWAPPVLPRRQLVWDKGQFGLSGTNLPWLNSHEVAWVFGDGWQGEKRGTVWRTPRNRDASHPTEKPLDLLLWLASCARPEWVILDPFMGSGSTLRAAKDLGRRAIGIEIEERYCEIAARRLDQGVLALESGGILSAEEPPK